MNFKTKINICMQPSCLKSGKANYKLSQLIAGTFPRQNSKQKRKQSLYWRTTRKRTNQNRRMPKREIQNSLGKIPARAGSICSQPYPTLGKKIKQHEMKNEKNYIGFFITKTQQILKRFGGTKTLAKTSYFWGVRAGLSSRH